MGKKEGEEEGKGEWNARSLVASHMPASSIPRSRLQTDSSSARSRAPSFISPETNFRPNDPGTRRGKHNLTRKLYLIWQGRMTHGPREERHENCPR